MTHIVEVNGQEIPFPDNWDDNQISNSLRAMESSSNPSSSSNQFGTQSGAPNDRTLIDVIRDLGAGAARGVQNLGAAGLEAGEYITRKGAERLGRELGHPVSVPKWNAREFAGLEGPNQIDLGSYIQGSRPDQLTQALGQYALPGSALKGAGLLKQMSILGGYGASQASPEEQNAFGLLPSGRVGAAIENAALPFAISKGIPALRSAAKSTYNALGFNAGNESEQYLKNLLSLGKEEKLPTSTENIEQLGKRMQLARQSATQEALAPKQALMQEEGTSNILGNKKSADELTKNITKIIEPSSTIDEQQAVRNALKKYYSNGGEFPIEDEIENIYGTELSPHKISRINEHLELQPFNNGKYLKSPEVDKNYKSLGLDELHDAYVENPNLKNADKLLSQMKEEQRGLAEKIRRKTADGNEKLQNRRLLKNISALEDDMNNFFQTLSPDKRNLYDQFRNLWRENVVKYGESSKKASVKKLINALSSGKSEGITQKNVSSAFTGEPNSQMKEIMSDIGKEGVNNIVYNELLTSDPRDAEELAKNIISARRVGGYDKLISEKDEEFANKLLKKLGRRKLTLKWGIPIIGSTIGYKAIKGLLPS